ncbi:pirin family protein [Poseidonibacter lekithochrous]|uniref:pirin family protein n=1 Tax=Poseidonibacter lekithochrous TaxID=1904463 RepID=UPI0008FC35B8|nr:pirin family protein [Poseidonibacter lekithochrous]QKJ21464.1 pirin family protein [Poseidonibacter lekithochrous]
MLKKLNKENMGTSNLGWLESRFHFSFAEYRNPANINFGVLRVLNDDIIHANGGFGTHPHENMEIISYITQGEIKHKDSMGNEEILKSGEVQYLSAGDGIYHSEYNASSTEDLKLLQIWIVPPKRGLERLYGSHRYTREQKENKLLNIVSSQEGNAQIKIHQDVNFYVSLLEENKSLDYKIQKDRQVYFVQISGTSAINGIDLNDGDAMEIVDEENLNIQAINDSHFLFIEMKKA